MYADLKNEYLHSDLLHICRRRGLRGGLKVVEQCLDIVRKTAGMTGWDAPCLWQRYESGGDEAALTTQGSTSALRDMVAMSLAGMKRP